MKIKRYVVKEMYEAIKLIKQDLGPEAVIVSSYRVPSKGLVGFFMPKLLEVTAALDEPQDAGRREKRLPLKLAAAGGNKISDRAKGPAEVYAFKQQEAEEQREAKTGKQALLDMLESVETAAKSADNAQADSEKAVGADSSFESLLFNLGANPEPAETGDRPGAEYNSGLSEVSSGAAPGVRFQQTGADLRTAAPEANAPAAVTPSVAAAAPTTATTAAVGSVAPESPSAVPTVVSGAEMVELRPGLSLAPVPAAPGSSLFGLMVKNELSLATGRDNWRQLLLDVDVEEEIADILLASLRDDLSEEPAGPDGVYMSIRKKAIELLEPAYKAEGKARILTFVGPTGVGKTTTLAKLATLLSFNESKNIALVAIQSYRLGPSEQLQEYAAILGVPAEVVMTPEELVRVLEKHSDKDYILIDTAGRSARNSGMLLELKSFINAVKEPQEVYLVMSITTKNRDLHRTVREYLRIGCSKLIFTKLDETDTFGSILNMVITHGLPAAYLSDGQVIPDCINEAGPRSISELLLRGIVNR